MKIAISTFLLLFVFASCSSSKGVVSGASSKSETTAVVMGKKISFFLTNDSDASIPLLIPSVMNPSLSPFSESGVSLRVGQEVLFREKGRKHILLIVDDSIVAGQKLEVSQLLQQRRKELGLL